MQQQPVRAPQYAINRLDMRSPAAFAASARLAESLGYGVGCLPSSPLLVQDPYVMLAAALQATSHLQLGPLIENPVMRHPAVIAGSMATIERLAPGRAWLGLGVGDTAVRLLGQRPARVHELEAATTMIRRLLAREAVEVGAAAPARLRHAARAPVWIAAQGPITLRMAGRVADGVFLRAGTSAKVLQHAIEQVRAGAQEAGRDPQAMRYAIVLHTVLGDDVARTEVVARAMAAGYYEYSPQLFELAGLTWTGPDVHELKKQVWPDFHHAADLFAAGEHVSFLPRDAMDAFCLHGDAPQVRAQLRAVLQTAAGLGVAFETVVLHPVLTRPAAADAPTANDVLTRIAANIVAHM